MVKKMLIFLLFLLFGTSAINAYRLPDDIIPIEYKVDILTYLGEVNNFNFDGSVSIEVLCLSPTFNITLHSKDLTLKKSGVTIQHLKSQKHDTDDNNQMNVKEITIDNENDFLIIQLNKTLQPSQKYRVKINFTGQLGKSLKGFYRSSYKDNNGTKWLGVTQFEPIAARRAFPCFDEPAMKATFQINLGRNKNFNSISNMPLKETVPINEKPGWFWDKYERSVNMSTYLVAFMVSDFGYKESPLTKNNVTFKVWARKSALDQVDFAADIGPKFLEYYQDFFDIDYPLPKQDMVAIPDFSAGAMENWGLITYRESTLLFEPAVSSTDNRHSVASVIAHELAHQWFGNLVTMKWWTDLWLNEGFATYMGSIAVENVFPKWKFLDAEIVNNVLSVFSFDSLRSSHPVSVPIGHPNEIDEIFDTISYKKGSFLIRMMTHFLGEKTFKEGVRSYLKTFKYTNAEQDDLWKSLTKQAHKDGALPKDLTVKTIMDTWTLQTGYPLITVTRQYDKNLAVIEQNRYLKSYGRVKGSEDKCWWVPLSYTIGQEITFNSTKPKLWLGCPKKVEVIENLIDNNQPSDKTWILFNVHIAGVYRVNYDMKNWRLLMMQLKSAEYDKIPVLNRVQLIDDAFDLSWNSIVSYPLAFDLIEYVKEQEVEYLPWRTTLTNIHIIDNFLRKTSIYGNFKKYMKALITTRYKEMRGFDLQEDKEVDKIKHQILMIGWACRFEVEDCVSSAKEHLQKYQRNFVDQTIIPKELRNTIYCTGLRYGGEKEWNFLWNKYKSSNIASEKTSILQSLGCTRETWLLTRYLDWAVKEDSGIRQQDVPLVFNSVTNNPIGYYIAKNFLFTRFKDIYSYLGGAKRVTRLLSSIVNHLTTPEEYEELKLFIQHNAHELREIKQGVEQSLEKAGLNVEWHKSHLEEISDYFSTFFDKKKSMTI